MHPFNRYIFSVLQGLILLLSFVSDWYAGLVISLITVTLFSVIDKLGKGIVLRELIALHTSFVCLAMPLLGYIVYNYENPLARIWVKYMMVPQEVYFSFALPAVAGFIFIMCWPLSNKSIDDNTFLLKNIFPRIRQLLSYRYMKKTGIIILLVGLMMFYLARALPASFQFASLLFYFSSFAGVLYIYFSPSFRRKGLVLTIFSLFLIGNALGSGMFTTVVYMGITIFSLLFLGRRVSFFRKLSIFVLGILLLITLQSVKPVYRSYAWQGYTGNKALLFINLMAERIAKGDFFSETSFFPIYTRTNQGFNIALVMRNVPAHQAHDQGEVLLRNIGAAIIPRFLWPDKPQAGGKFNMKYYAGFVIEGWSTNIGPLGEAYGGFGVKGGIIYMILLGFFIRWAYRKVLLNSRNLPLLVLWVPVFFFQITYSAETDTLQIMNSLLKSAFFVWLLFKITPQWFGKFTHRKSSNKRDLPFRSTGLESSEHKLA
jgi:hypothetical protein